MTSNLHYSTPNQSSAYDDWYESERGTEILGEEQEVDDYDSFDDTDEY